ncbi:MAG TPA: S58 family peptidase [Gammaproteobacteria bacterium]|nr:S58 family peptidase [Gammaproteobacteria bacterium]HIK69637.1 S58 family peptidase [Pseudomonadales bacterium]
MTQQIRNLGVNLPGKPGANNAITDVAGVSVGHHTLISGHGQRIEGQGPVRTGVTAIIPSSPDLRSVFAAGYSLNGAGELTGMHWIEESGILTGPICITNTHSVGAVHEAVIQWMNQREMASDMPFCLPVVGETYDGFLNDINGFHVKAEHVFKALDGASAGKVAQGNVGGGTGMICHQFKGGIGSASRQVTIDSADYTLGVLVQANYGQRESLTINGVPVGSQITDLMPSIGLGEKGSIIVIIASDAPLLPHQLKRLARRVPMGMARVGSYAGNLSGDIFIAFSTANTVAAESPLIDLQMLPNQQIEPLFKATVEATEEAILNALTAAETMTGINDTTVHQLPHDRVRDLMGKYGR